METKIPCSKTFCFTKETDERKIEITIPEVIDPGFGMYVWPCAPILAQFIWVNDHKVRGKTVVELGAGTALPGVLAGKLGAKITLTDGEHLPECLDNCRKSCAANGLEHARTVGLTWGSFSEEFFNLIPVDIILGSDCFYDPKDFEDIIVSVTYLLQKSPGSEFWTTYQQRSVNRSIEHLLDKWNLSCQQIPLSEFGADGETVAGVQTSTHSVQMLVMKYSGESS